MYLKIDELEILNIHLTGVIIDGSQTLMFQGRAIEDEGKEICRKLSMFQEGQVVEVKAELKNYSIWEGICKVIKISCQTPKIDSPTAKELIYRFWGSLELVV